MKKKYAFVIVIKEIDNGIDFATLIKGSFSYFKIVFKKSHKGV